MAIELPKYPPALHAAEMIAKTFTYGDIVTEKTVFELLDIELVDKHAPCSLTEAERDAKRFVIFNATTRMLSKLLEDHLMWLVRVRKPEIGYVIVEPAEQTSQALADLEEHFRKGTRKALERLLNINREQLTVDEQRSNADALNKVAYLVKTTGRTLGFEHDVNLRVKKDPEKDADLKVKKNSEKDD